MAGGTPVDYDETFTCARCGFTGPCFTPGKGTGNYYGLHGRPERWCPPCAEKNHREDLLKEGRGVLYLETPGTPGRPTGVPQTLTWACVERYRVKSYREGRHNIARSRWDVWFTLPGDGFLWWGVQYGDWTMICHVKRTKEAVECA